MKEQENNNPGHQGHSLGMIKEKNGSYYPGCVDCKEPIVIVKPRKINLKIKEKGSPVS